MSTWGLELHCVRCSGDLRYVNGTVHGNKDTNLTVAVLVCDACRTQFEVNVRIRQMAWTADEMRDFDRQRKAS
jgi:hypothetical protein